jgi:hypothetical protein
MGTSDEARGAIASIFVKIFRRLSLEHSILGTLRTDGWQTAFGL